MQDAVSHSIHFGSVQPNTQHHHLIYGISIIETIRSQISQGGHDQESHLHVSEPEFMVQRNEQSEENGVTAGIGEEMV